MLDRTQFCLLTSLTLLGQGCLANADTIDTSVEAASAADCAYEQSLPALDGEGRIEGTIESTTELPLFDAVGDLYISVTDEEDAVDGVADTPTALVVIRDVDLRDGASVDFSVDGLTTGQAYVVVPFLDVNGNACIDAVPAADGCDYVAPPVYPATLDGERVEVTRNILLSLGGNESRESGSGSAISVCNTSLQITNF